MKIVTFILGSCLLAAITLLAQVDREMHRPLTREKSGLKGPIRTLKVETQRIVTVDGKVNEWPRVPVEEATFDTQGRKTEFKIYNQKGNLVRWNFYSYEAGILRRSIAKLYDSDGLLYRVTEYTYDEEKGLTNQVNDDYDDNNKVFRRTILSKDATGAPIVKEIKIAPTPKPVKRKSPDEDVESDGLGNVEQYRDVVLNKTNPKILPVRRRMQEETDQYGNWIKRIPVSEVDQAAGQKIEIVILILRELTYY